MTIAQITALMLIGYLFFDSSMRWYQMNLMRDELLSLQKDFKAHQLLQQQRLESIAEAVGEVTERAKRLQRTG